MPQSAPQNAPLRTAVARIEKRDRSRAFHLHFGSSFRLLPEMPL
jgi:hypothetical protein